MPPKSPTELYMYEWSCCDHPCTLSVVSINSWIHSWDQTVDRSEKKTYSTIRCLGSRWIISFRGLRKHIIRTARMTAQRITASLKVGHVLLGLTPLSQPTLHLNCGYSSMQKYIFGSTVSVLKNRPFQDHSRKGSSFLSQILNTFNRSSKPATHWIHQYQCSSVRSYRSAIKTQAHRTFMHLYCRTEGWWRYLWEDFTRSIFLLWNSLFLHCALDKANSKLRKRCPRTAHSHIHIRPLTGWLGVIFCDCPAVNVSQVWP